MDRYGKARREGLRAYNAAVQEHGNPYLPVLEELVPEARIAVAHGLANASKLLASRMRMPFSTARKSFRSAEFPNRNLQRRMCVSDGHTSMHPKRVRHSATRWRSCIRACRSNWNSSGWRKA